MVRPHSHHSHQRSTTTSQPCTTTLIIQHTYTPSHPHCYTHTHPIPSQVCLVTTWSCCPTCWVVIMWKDWRGWVWSLPWSSCETSRERDWNHSWNLGGAELIDIWLWQWCVLLCFVSGWVLPCQFVSRHCLISCVYKWQLHWQRQLKQAMVAG